MKTAKKLFALALTLVLMLALAAPALAAGDGSITIKNAVVNEKYTLYKVFDLQYIGAGENETDGDDLSKGYEGVSYTYTAAGDGDTFLAALNSGDSPFALSSTGGSTYQVTLKTGKGENDVVSFLKANVSDAMKVGETKTATAAADGDTTATVKFESIAYGYYYITSTLGSLVTVNSTIPNVVVTEKNEMPTLTKTADKTTASVGDTITYTITLTVPDSADKEIVVHDKMGAGLTMVDGSLSAKIGETDVAYTQVTDKKHADCTFELSFEAETVKGKSITITYQATVNEQAAAGAETSNTAWLTYSEQEPPTPPDPVEVSTYSFDLVKTGPAAAEGGNTYPVLTGAKFKLYDAETGGNEISLVKVTDDENGDYYRPALESETPVESIEAGEVTVKGLAGDAAYYLEEVEAPTGYNKLEGRTSVAIVDADLTNTASNDGEYTKGENDTGIQVINNTGAELPETGGIGTTIFYVLGGVLVVGAVVLLVTRKRMREE